MALVIKNLTQTYTAGKTSFASLEFRVERDIPLVILGESESGKTSLLKAIAGLYPSSLGDIILDGFCITNIPIKERDVLMIYQDLGLSPRSSVYSNLSRGLKIRRINVKNRRFLIFAAAKKFKVDSFLRDKASSLSPINIIRVAFLRTYIRTANITLIDNPFLQANADRKKCFREMLPVIKNLRNYVIFATDSLDEAASLGGKIVIMRFGIIEQIGTMLDLRDNPQKLYVDCYLNPLRNTVIISPQLIDNNIFIEILGKKVMLTDKSLYDFVGKEIYVTYLTRLGVDIRTDNRCSYICDGKKVAMSYFFDSIIFTELPLSFDEETKDFGNRFELNLTVDIESLRFYSLETEKRII